MHALTYGLLGAAALAYAIGLRRVGAAERWCFAGAMVALLGALVSPLHHLAGERLWAHMVQHEVLMIVAAPLIVLGQPLRAVPVRVPRWLSDPALAWIAHAAAIWLWHVPGWFEAAAKNDALHFAQHATFLVSAILFWWTVLTPRRRVLVPVLSLFTTMVHTGALGALMALAGRVWYAGCTLDDQQLAGLVMWIPAGLAYPLAALYLVSRTLRR